jgi:hypothetical protein
MERYLAGRSVEGVPVTPESARLGGLLAITIRHHGHGPETDRLARDLRAARAAEYIRDLTDSLPALTVEQRARLARLLLPGGDA